MKVVVKTQQGILKELDVEDQSLPVRKPTLKLDVINLDKLPFDILFLICTYLEPEDLIYLNRCSTKLHNFCIDPTIWKDMAIRENSKMKDAEKKHFVLEHLRSKDGSHIMKTMICRIAAARIWNILEAYLGRAQQKTLNNPATEYDLIIAEEQLGFQLPDQIRGSWLVHNGQSKLEGSSGIIDGGYLVSLKEMVKFQREFESNIRTKGLDPNVIQYLTGYQNLSEAETFEVLVNTRWIPLTGKIGYKQWCTETTTGSIYVFSGWNVIKKGDSWFSFLNGLLG